MTFSELLVIAPLIPKLPVRAPQTGTPAAAIRTDKRENMSSADGARSVAVDKSGAVTGGAAIPAAAICTEKSGATDHDMSSADGGRSVAVDKSGVVTAGAETPAAAMCTENSGTTDHAMSSADGARSAEVEKSGKDKSSTTVSSGEAEEPIPKSSNAASNGDDPPSVERQARSSTVEWHDASKSRTNSIDATRTNPMLSHAIDREEADKTSFASRLTTDPIVRGSAASETRPFVRLMAVFAAALIVMGVVIFAVLSGGKIGLWLLEGILIMGVSGTVDLAIMAGEQSDEGELELPVSLRSRLLKQGARWLGIGLMRGALSASEVIAFDEHRAGSWQLWPLAFKVSQEVVVEIVLFSCVMIRAHHDRKPNVLKWWVIKVASEVISAFGAYSPYPLIGKAGLLLYLLTATLGLYYCVKVLDDHVDRDEVKNGYKLLTCMAFTGEYEMNEPSNGHFQTSKPIYIIIDHFFRRSILHIIYCESRSGVRSCKFSCSDDVPISLHRTQRADCEASVRRHEGKTLVVRHSLFHVRARNREHSAVPSVLSRRLSILHPGVDARIK